jgi:hypothetical protein
MAHQQDELLCQRTLHLQHHIDVETILDLLHRYVPQFFVFESLRAGCFKNLCGGCHQVSLSMLCDYAFTRCNHRNGDAHHALRDKGSADRPEYLFHFDVPDKIPGEAAGLVRARAQARAWQER